MCEEGVFNSICNYMQSSQHTDREYMKVIKPMKDKLREAPELREVDIEDDKSLSLETQHMLNMVSMLKGMKSKMTPEFIAELKAMDVSGRAENEKK